MSDTHLFFLRNAGMYTFWALQIPCLVIFITLIASVQQPSSSGTGGSSASSLTPCEHHEVDWAEALVVCKCAMCVWVALCFGVQALVNSAGSMRRVSRDWDAQSQRQQRGGSQRRARGGGRQLQQHEHEEEAAEGEDDVVVDTVYSWLRDSSSALLSAGRAGQSTTGAGGEALLRGSE
jgi:hypothetical protein